MAPPSPVPGFPNVRFVNQDQKTRFRALHRYPMVPTRFLDMRMLTELGLDGAMREFMVLTRTVGLYDAYADTYEDLTLEFLSSFVYDKRAKTVFFRLCNQNFPMTLHDFGTHLGIGSDGLLDTKKTVIHDNWRALTGVPPSSISKARTNKIHHPIVRIWARLIAYVLFPRNDVDYLKRMELSMICSGLTAHRGNYFFVNVAHHVCETLATVATDSLSKVYGGGIASLLADKLLDPPEIDQLKPLVTDIHDRRQLSTIHLNAMLSHNHWLRRRPAHMGQYYWMIEGEESIILPPPTIYASFMRLPPLFRSTYSPHDRDVPDFTMHRGNIEDWINVEHHVPSFFPEPNVPSRRGDGRSRAQGSTSHPTPTSHDHETCSSLTRFTPYDTLPPLTSFANEDLANYMHQMSVQQTIVANDNARAMYPFYDNACRQGYIAPSYQHPGYYTYPQDGNFGPCSYGGGFPQGFMGPFGGHTSGMNAPNVSGGEGSRAATVPLVNLEDDEEEEEDDDDEEDGSDEDSDFEDDA